MGTGAIVLLVTLATIAAIRSNNRMVVGDTAGAVVTGALFDCHRAAPVPHASQFFFLPARPQLAQSLLLSNVEP